MKMIRIAALLGLLLLAISANAQVSNPTGVGGTTLQQTPVYAAPDFLANSPFNDPLPANVFVNVVARDNASTWVFIRYNGPLNPTASGASGTGSGSGGDESSEPEIVNYEGWIPASTVSINGALPLGVATGTVIDADPTTYLEPNALTSSRIVRPTYVVKQGDTVVISTRDTSGAWYFLRRPDGKYNWMCANDIQITSGSIANVPVWTIVPSDPSPCGSDPVPPQPPQPPTTPPDTLMGTVLQQTPLLIRIFNSPTQVNSVPASAQLAVLAYTDASVRYYLVRYNNQLGWVDASRVSVTALPPEV
jgi:hypothetical protein